MSFPSFAAYPFAVGQLIKTTRSVIVATFPSQHIRPLINWDNEDLWEKQEQCRLPEGAVLKVILVSPRRSGEELLGTVVVAEYLRQHDANLVDLIPHENSPCQLADIVFLWFSSHPDLVSDRNRVEIEVLPTDTEEDEG